MRIIRGLYKTRRFKVPKNFPSRPTTDFAKEGLFNILENRLMLHDLRILDLCAGSGNISIEFLSREAGTVVSVDRNFNCVRHIKQIAETLGCTGEIDIIKSDMFKYVKHAGTTFDLIFADPPYAYEDYETLIDEIFERGILAEDGLLIIEHGKETTLENRPHFEFMRKYGGVHFSFFKIGE